MLSVTERVRIWKPAMSAEDIRLTKEALDQGRHRMFLESGVIRPEPRKLIWWLMQEAAETWRRLPDKERAWRLYRVMWPEIARPSEDCRAIEWDISMEQIMGVREPERTTYRLTITDPSAVDRAEIVYKWLQFVRSKNPRRDKAAFIALAEGRGSRAAAQEMGGRVTDYAVRRVKDKILGQILAGLNRCIDGCR